MTHPATTIILAGKILDGTGGRAQRQMAVTIVGDRIVTVEPIASVGPATRAAATVIDGGAATLTPGLIDAHVHVAWGLADQPGWAAAGASRGGLLAWSIAAVQGALAAGVTSVRDCGAPGLVTVELRDAIVSGAVCGPRVVAAGTCITTTGGHGDFIGVPADDIEQLRRRVRQLGRDGVDFIKVMASGGSMDPHTDRRRAQYTASELAALVDEAHQLSLPVVAHCNATESIRNAASAGVDTIAHCNWLGAEEGTIDYDPAVADRIVAQGIFVDLNLAATMRPLAEYDGSAQSWTVERPPANRWELHDTIRDVGGRVLFSSDAFGPAVSEFPHLLGRAISTLGVDPVEAIHRATLVPAQACGLGDELGVVTPGRLADLALFDGDIETDPTSLERCRAVWRSGRLVALSGRIDAGAMAEEVTRVGTSTPRDVSHG